MLCYCVGTSVEAVVRAALQPPLPCWTAAAWPALD